MLASMRVGLLLAALSYGTAASGPAHASDAGRPYTIGDFLRLESVGKAAADPSGRRIVWELAPSYDRQPDYSVDQSGTWSGAYRLMTVEPGVARPKSVPLFPPAADRQYWFDSFSPDGRFVAFYSARRGRIEMGSYDTRSKRVRYFSAAPDIDWAAGRESTWISSSAFVYSAYAGGGQPVLGQRRAYGEAIAEAWRKSWSGNEPSVTPIVSHAAETTRAFKAGRLLLVNAETGHVEVLADGMYQDIRVSRDGRYLAALRQAQRPQPDPAEANVDWTVGRSQLVLFDLRQPGAPQVIAPDLDVFPNTLAWSPQQDRLAFFGWKPGDSATGGIFWTVEVGTGQVTPYPHTGLDLASQRERGWLQKPERVLWIGDRLAMFARAKPPGDEVPSLTYRNVAGRGAAVAAKADWFLVDRNGARQNLTRDLGTVSAIPLYSDGATIDVLADGAIWRVGPDAVPQRRASAVAYPLSLLEADRSATLNRPFRQAMAFLGRDARGTHMVFVDFPTGQATEIEAPAPRAIPLAVSPTTKSMLYRSTDDAVDEVLLRSAAGVTRRLYSLNPHLRAVARTHWQPVTYAVASDTGSHQVQGCLLLPVGYQAGRRYPVVVDVYPATTARSCIDPERAGANALGARQGSSSAHLFAAKEYIVFKPNTARDLTRTAAGPIAGMPDVVLQGVDALVRLGYADPARLGLYGVSQGGFSSLWVATQTSRFRAVVSVNGWSDLYAHYFENPFALRLFTQERPHGGNERRYLPTAGGDFSLGSNPHQDIDRYMRNSPLLHADKITAPVLLVHSDMDAFNLSQYEAMFTALYQQRKEAKLLQYWGEGHSPSSPANIRHLWMNTLDWYDRYLDVGRDTQGALVWDNGEVKGREAPLGHKSTRAVVP